jgi:hypothetical protein
MTLFTLDATEERLTHYEAQAAKLGNDLPHPAEDALTQVGSGIMNEVLDLLTGTALENHIDTIAEALIGGLHSACQRIERDAERARDDLRRAHRDFDGSEISDNQIQEFTAKAFEADVSVMAIEMMRSSAAETYTVGTGNVWQPWKGSVKATRVTAATIDARDALRSMKARANAATDPGAQVVLFRGSQRANTAVDAMRIYDALNWAKTKFPDMALAATPLKGAEALALKWAKDNGVRTVLSRPNFDKFSRAAPFRANDEMLEMEPVLVLTLAASLDDTQTENAPFGPAANLGQKAEAAGVKHIAISSKA